MQGWEGYPPTLMSKQRITGFRRKRLLYSKTFLALVSFPKKNPKPKKQKKKIKKIPKQPENALFTKGHFYQLYLK